MQDARQQPETSNAAETAPPQPWIERAWRPAGTAAVVGLALLLTWHVVNGQHGLSVWHQMRSEDRELQKEIKDLQQENDQLRKQIDRLQTDPKAIEHEAREKLHYARQDEVIYTMPNTDQPQGK
jgi:cell division protein FtsB